MIGSFITRGLVLIFGYAFPAYECYKTVEMNKPDIEQLIFWCKYWILVAMLTVCERISDMFIGWVPMYGEAKLAFFIYLWFPKTKGTAYVYESFFRPYVAKHETDIDRNLLELRTRAGDMVLLYWQKAASYSQTKVFEILQYIASQSTPSRPPQTQPQTTKVQNPSRPSNRKSAATTKSAQNESLPPLPDSSTSSGEDQEDDDDSEEAGPSENSKAAPVPPAVSNELKTAPTLALAKRSKSPDSTEEKVMQVETVVTAEASENTQIPPQDTAMVEATRVTRARSRKTRGGGA